MVLIFVLSDRLVCVIQVEQRPKTDSHVLNSFRGDLDGKTRDGTPQSTRSGEEPGASLRECCLVQPGEEEGFTLNDVMVVDIMQVVQSEC